MNKKVIFNKIRKYYTKKRLTVSKIDRTLIDSFIDCILPSMNFPFICESKSHLILASIEYIYLTNVMK